MSTSTALRLASNARPVVAQKSVAPRQSPEQVARRRWFAAEKQPRLNEVLSTLYVKYAKAVTRCVVRWGVPEADAQDVCAEVFIVAQRKLPSYEGRSSISTWLFGIAHKLASDHRRSSRSKLEVLMDVTPEHGEAQGTVEQLEHAEVLQSLHVAIEGLKPTQREVVTGYALQELPMDAVAKRARVPAQTAYARLYSAHAALRESLAASR